MTDKQIIIDGIDVSGCAERSMCINCETVTNCYYKQLKRKEQEYERLKRDYFKQNEWLQEQKKELDQLKAENEELKEDYATAKMEICNQCGEKDDYNIPCKQIRDLDYGLQLEIEENEKLSHTLTEIKEIAERAKKDICNNCGWRNTDSCDPEDYTCGEFIKILQKISEVEDDRN